MTTKQRPIKFRLVKDGKVVGYERHFVTVNKFIEIQHREVGEDWEDIIIECRSDIDCFSFIPHDAKEQFTGMVDKSGTEIYENDEITFWKGRKGKVYMCVKQAGWGVKCGENYYALGALDNIEIVGRIEDE